LLLNRVNNPPHRASISQLERDMADSNYSRRWLLQRGLLAAAIIPAIGFRSEAATAAAPELSSADPAASALGYIDDASAVDAKGNPTYKADQSCATCSQFQGKAGDTRGACSIFPGKSVAAKGWCKVWAKRPG
jgi:hypothetical protein